MSKKLIILNIAMDPPGLLGDSFISKMIKNLHIVVYKKPRKARAQLASGMLPRSTQTDSVF